MASGKFIVLEGGEGAGKSTQARLLAESLRNFGIDAIVTREPGGTPFAETIRDKLRSGTHAAEGPDAEAILISAGRIDHLDAVIRPALRKGTWVICDRFTDSTRAYQGALCGGDMQFLDALIAHSIGNTSPDLTLLIDVPTVDAQARLSARGDAEARFDSNPAEKFDLLRQAFLEMAEADPACHRIIDGTGDQADVAERIRSAVASHFDLAGN